MFKCECEHEEHFDSPQDSHAYGQEHDPRQRHDIKTAYGFFSLCKDCHDRKHMTIADNCETCGMPRFYEDRPQPCNCEEGVDVE